VQLNHSVRPEGLQVTEGSADFLLLGTILKRASYKTHLYTLHNFVHKQWNILGRGPWMRAHCKHNQLVLSSVSNNNFSLLIYGCMCIGILGHKPRYMGRLSNNNNILINNSLCSAIRVVYIQITKMWDIRYIDEGFVVQIIPSTYLSHEP